MTENDWKKALDFCDRAQLTLSLGLTSREHLPESVRSRIDDNLAANSLRWDRVKAAYQEIAGALQAEKLDFLVVKGFAHCPRFAADPRHRRQGDIDLLLPREDVLRAYDAALQLGYEPINAFERHPLNHLPTLIRKTGWEWRGDYFDVDQPLSLELHFQLWNAPVEHFGPNGLEKFWERRQSRQLEDLRFVELHPADAVANAALHMLRHLLRGSLRPLHVYELAWMLHHSADDPLFWQMWASLHEESLRRLEAVCFSIAQHWFDCRLPAAAEEEIQLLPSEVVRWLANYSTSPLAGRFHPNKDELWLHWNLLDSTSARLAVLRRRLLPVPMLSPAGPVHIPKHELDWRKRLAGRRQYLVFAARRAWHHLRSLPATAWSAARWFGARAGLGSHYWRFFFAEGFFDFGMFVFVFLFNLYLLQLGFRENFLGLMAGTMTAGSIAGSILAAAAMQRFGIRRTLLTGFALTACFSALRAYITLPEILLGLAAASGIAASAWPVALAPVVTQLTNDKNRAFGFSLVCSSGIAIGILGGLAAGRLPGWLLNSHLASTRVESYRESLFIGCAFVLLALWRFSKVNMGATAPAQRVFHRPSPVVTRFLIAMLVWHLGTGALNPFFNVFFARRVLLPVEQIGIVFAIAQIAQVGAILFAPLVFRKFGLTRSISGMQYATALALVGLAIAGGPVWAAFGYAAYMMFQNMSEPGLFTLLMEGAPPGERSSASALNFLAAFSGQAIAAAASGALITRFGYPPVMLAAGVTCGAAALLFRVLLANPKPDAPSNP